MSENEGSLRRAVSLIIEAGYQIDREAFEFLRSVSHQVELDSLIKSILEEIKTFSEKPLYITLDIIKEKVEKRVLTSVPKASCEVSSKTSFKPYAKEVKSDLKIISDPTNEISATGSLNDCIEYFRSRFKKISKILRSRVNVKDAGTIVDALKAPENSEIKIICIIMDKRETKRGIFFRIEDLESQATAFVPAENREVYFKAQRILLDQVICISVVKGKEDLLIVKDIILPDVPMRKPNKSTIPVYAALLSDLHIGSKMFMRKAFERLIMWLRGEIGNSWYREIASYVKYLIVAGDVVDGVGIYPQQYEELEIKDIYRQYEEAAALLERIPEYIEVIIIPGNHDATRRALPQPAIPRNYAEPLYELGRIHMLGDPSIISLHNVIFLLSHGRSIDDIIATVPNMSFQSPDEAMKILLQCRHLAPTYGMRTLIAPEKVDHLVIENVPDIFHAGHVHLMKYSTYRGILIVNSGAFQEQTEYQREMGHIPNPGIIPVVNLSTLEVTPIDFSSIY
ncbi:DNA-directed DNA polymerase II small subunit [Candidatus Bathyarchaeota archaeon]|nr:DNA-directed DNA polymerase II small subunit [Candidatus Bathyarchaeota archaeon]